MPLHELKALGRAHDATLNDMVLMLCSSALRRFYAKRRQLPRKSLVAAVPISLREKGDTTRRQPGLDEPDQPGHAHRRPGASGWRT